MTNTGIIVEVVTAGPQGLGSAWLQGAGVPSSGLGGNGDYYLNTSNGDIYGPKTAGAWGSVIFNIAQGQTGPTGATGAAGATGPAGSAGVVAATAPITYDSGTQTVGISAATTGAAGSMSAADKSKLNGIAEGATANQTDAYLISRANHTGTQLSTTIGDSTAAGRALLTADTTGEQRTALGLGTAAVRTAGYEAGNVPYLDGGGLVPAAILPSYVDDVLEYANTGAFPATGESGKIYVATGTGKTYRWSGSTYVEISASPGSTDAVPEGVTNLYHTTQRAADAAPVQSVAGRTGAVTLTVSDVASAASIGLAAGLSIALG
jgi:hypothetical protein